MTRVAREVGTEGKLGGQAIVPGVAGTWKDLTDSVNSMAGNLTAQVRNIAEVTIAVANGDLSKKITVDVHGEILQLKDTINTMVDQLNAFAAEVTRVAREVGTEGKLGGQAVVPGVAGTWKDLTDNVNTMAGNLTDQVRNIAEVTIAVANGDLSKKITVDVRGEILQFKDTMNTMVDQLRSFAAEVTRVAREVGTEGELGGQAIVPGVAGTWKDLTDSVNAMASNLTVQLRDMSNVATAIANGDLTRQITVDVRGRNSSDQRRHQPHGRAAQRIRVGNNPCRQGGRHRREARRAGGRTGRCRDLEGFDGQRQSISRQSHDTGPGDRRGRDLRDPGQSDALDPGAGPRRGGRAQGQHQRDDQHLAGHHGSEYRTGLAQDQPGEVHPHDAGPARPGHGGPIVADGIGASRQRAIRRDLSTGSEARIVRGSRCWPAMPGAEAKGFSVKCRSGRVSSANARWRNGESY